MKVSNTKKTTSTEKSDWFITLKHASEWLRSLGSWIINEFENLVSRLVPRASKIRELLAQRGIIHFHPHFLMRSSFSYF